MNDISTAKMSSISFDPQDFVKELTSKPSVSIDALLMARKSVQSLADETNSQLKRNVYKNYSLFIDTAKEISYLKSEMFQLNHLLTDQQNLMSSLLDVSIGGHRPGLTASEKKEALDKVKEKREKEVFSAPNTVSKELSALLDKIEGSAGILDTRTRASILFCGELMELDINDYKAIQPIFAILLNDGLIVSSILPPNTRNQRKYKFQTIYDLDNIAVVNVKDPNFETAFKILMFPTTKVFRADSKQTKNQWLDTFETAKKQRKTSLTIQRRDSLMYISNMSIDGTQTSTGGKAQMSPIDRPFTSVLNPFEEAELLEEVAESDAELVPQWLTELPEDLDVCIAQRNFEDAVQLVLKVNDHFSVYPKCCDNIMQTDLKLRIEHRIKELIDALTNDLQIAPDRSLQTGPRSSRRAVCLLLKLGKSSLATKLFLNQRSALLKFCLKQQKIEGATLQYIKRMSSVFFNNVIETTKEFQKAFDLSVQTNGALVATPPSSLMNDNLSISGEKLSPTHHSLPMSCLVSWARNQLNHFIGLFSRHVFTTQVSPSVAAECVAIIRYQSSKMKASIGMDLTFYLDKHLKADVERIINEIKDKLLEAIKLRAAEDKWVPQNFQNKIKISKFFEDMKDNGIQSIEKYVFDEFRVDLTSNSTTFAKSYLNAMKDLLKLSTSLTKKLVIEALVLTFKAQMKHIATSLKSPQFKAEQHFIEKNATFLLEVVLTHSQQNYCERMATKKCEELSRMQSDYAYLKGSIEPKPRSRSKASPTKTAYSSTTYL